MKKNYSLLIAILLTLNFSLFSQTAPPWDFNGTVENFVGSNYSSIVAGDSYATYTITSPNNDGNGGSANPNSYISGITRTLPKEWPLTGERAIQRDISITYDSGSGDCATEASTISTLFGYLINVIDTASKGNGNYFTNQSITRNAPAQTNTLLAGGGICYNVVSAMSTLADLLEDTLGQAPEMYRQAQLSTAGGV